MKSFEGKYSGRIFLVGNGTSLLETPLKELHPAFATNRIAQIFDSTDWRPDFFMAHAKSMEHEDVLADIKKVVELGIPSFIWDERKGLLDYPNITWTTYYAEHFWEDDLSVMSKWSNSGVNMIRMSMYLGFNEIILVGFDGIFRPYKKGEPDPNHFFGVAHDGLMEKKAEIWNREFPKAHRLALDAAKRMGVTILDATIGGQLNIYPRLENLFNG